MVERVNIEPEKNVFLRLIEVLDDFLSFISEIKFLSYSEIFQRMSPLFVEEIFIYEQFNRYAWNV